MIDVGRLKTIANLTLVAGILAVISLCDAQAPTSRSDTDQIEKLMTALSRHSVLPADVLDPNLSKSERDKNLQRLNTPDYVLNIVPEDVPEVKGDVASVHIRVLFDDRHGNTLDVDSIAKFVKRGGTWYFSSFDFLKWPGFLIAVLIFGAFGGIMYAAAVLVLWTRLSRKGKLGTNGIKMFLPIFWPSLFRMIRN
jgi:hypothetical protein